MNNADIIIVVLDIEVIEVENTITEEQIENIKKQIIEVIEAFKPIVESLLQVYEKMKDYFIKLWSELRTFIEQNKMDKIIKIYKRTKSRRIKKKQITKMIKILQNFKK